MLYLIIPYLALELRGDKMAEALAVVGIVANIIQIVDFGSRVLKRLEEYQSELGEIPEAFRHIKVELPVLLDALQRTKAAIDAESVRDGSKNALLPAVEGCGVQIKALDDVIAEVLPASDDSWVIRRRKALRSLRRDAKVKKITAVVRGYIQALTFHAAASSSLLKDPLAGKALAWSRSCIYNLTFYYYKPEHCLVRPLPPPFRSSVIPTL
ncbi:hypothetical protein GP486_005285 [Trichoglossum hirsutum]|uniref:NACHT-NTPase and P-loop NTPases N-terminal domain-containing protein n=1 Tax=Trichoglossum hirsutum TaxID=265104 RepID=A0A9P8L9F8_9PEZI|nr:hypothetical protein GP486_005285 [Trichoglossum hirsutum]